MAFSGRIKSRLSKGLVALALASLQSSALAQTCPEPGATDLDGSAVPVSLSLDAETLSLDWADVAAERYRVSRGRMEALRAGNYDHHLVAETTGTSQDFPEPKGSYYFLVAGDCPSGLSPTGRLSDGTERPPARTVELLLALSGFNPNLGGMSFTLTHPQDLVNTSSMVEPVDALDVPDLFWQVNVEGDGEVRATAVLETPFRSPADTWLVRFGWPSLEPVLNDFLLESCIVSDAEGLDAVGVTCAIDGFWVD